MPQIRARQIHLVNRPAGLPVHGDFKLVTVKLLHLKAVKCS